MPDFLTTKYVAETLPQTKTKPRPEMRCDVLVIGAGPTGLACAIDAQRLGLKVIVVDKGCLVNSLFHYPAGMVFFTTPELLEIGGKNSAAIASLDLWRHGARVTLVHRESQVHNHVKYWIKPDIENRIKNGDIKAYFNSTVQEIDVDYVVLNTPRGPVRLKND